MIKNELFRKNYPSKLILFGEYTVLLKGDVLATPLHEFTASWQYDKPTDNQAFTAHLIGVLGNYPDLVFEEEKWRHFTAQGGHLASSVPEGYGLGSSGTYVAAVYDQFVSNKNAIDHDLVLLKKVLGEIESFFHGRSSGIDPLVIYLEKTVRTTNGIPYVINHTDFTVKWTLIDSNQRRNTQVLVEDFKRRMQHSEFVKAMERLTFLNNKIMDEVLTNEPYDATLYDISEIQYEWLSHLIPNHFATPWREGLESGHNLYKLCGAGGGGYYLRFDI
jgi:mevalonate kinase